MIDVKQKKDNITVDYLLEIWYNVYEVNFIFKSNYYFDRMIFLK